MEPPRQTFEKSHTIALFRGPAQGCANSAGVGWATLKLGCVRLILREFESARRKKAETKGEVAGGSASVQFADLETGRDEKWNWPCYQEGIDISAHRNCMCSTLGWANPPGGGGRGERQAVCYRRT